MDLRRRLDGEFGDLAQLRLGEHRVGGLGGGDAGLDEGGHASDQGEVLVLVEAAARFRSGPGGGTP